MLKSLKFLLLCFILNNKDKGSLVDNLAQSGFSKQIDKNSNSRTSSKTPI
jgi:hypothetical protein